MDKPWLTNIRIYPSFIIIISLVNETVTDWIAMSYKSTEAAVAARAAAAITAITAKGAANV